MRWSARAVSAADLPAVLGLFTEPDFHFRTTRPDTASEREVLALVGEDTRLLLADGLPVGLYAVTPTVTPHAGHHRLALRLTAAAPAAWWLSALREITRWLRWRTEAVRLSWQLAETDLRALEVARAAGFVEEGVLADRHARGATTSGVVCFARFWPVAP